MKPIKRPSILDQQNLENKEPDEILEGLSTISIICMSLDSLNSVTAKYNNIFTDSTKLCISIPSTKGTVKKLSVDSSNLEITQITQLINFKTQPCKYWESGVKCPYAKNCRFAHGLYQKRSKETVKDLYKTKICKNFFELGSCKYGARCQFLHQKKPYERQTQYYRKKMSQIHKDTELFFMDQKRLAVLRLIQLGDNKQNSPSPPSSENSIKSSHSIKNKEEKIDFSLSNYCQTSKKGRYFSTCI